MLDKVALSGVLVVYNIRERDMLNASHEILTIMYSAMSTFSFRRLDKLR